MILRFEKAQNVNYDWFCWDTRSNFPPGMRFIRAHDFRAWFLKWVGGRK